MNHTPSTEEHVSALLDDALNTRETDLLLDRLRDDPVARARLDRYALIGMAMRGESAGLPSGRDLSAGVMAGIRKERSEAPIVIGTRPAEPFGLRLERMLQDWIGGWRMPALGMALTVLVVGVVVLLASPGRNAPDPSFVALTPPPAKVGHAAAQDEDAMPDPYLMQHLTYAEGGAMASMSSNVRLVAYERP
ncbi:MAG: sigma-E factor negative regulatory protein [Pseudomonadota bacterium]